MQDPYRWLLSGSASKDFSIAGVPLKLWTYVHTNALVNGRTVDIGVIAPLFAAFLGGLFSGVVSPYVTHRFSSVQRREETLERIQVETWYEIQDATSRLFAVYSEHFQARMVAFRVSGRWPDKTPASDDYWPSSVGPVNHEYLKLRSRLEDDELRQLAQQFQRSIQETLLQNSRSTAIAKLDEASKVKDRVVERAGYLLRT